MIYAVLLYTCVRSNTPKDDIHDALHSFQSATLKVTCIWTCHVSWPGKSSSRSQILTCLLAGRRLLYHPTQYRCGNDFFGWRSKNWTTFRLRKQKWVKNNQDNQIQSITLCNNAVYEESHRGSKFLPVCCRAGELLYHYQLELYALPHPNFKFHVPTLLRFGLRSFNVHLLPLSGTHRLATFVSVNL